MEIAQYFSPGETEKGDYQSFMWGNHIKRFTQEGFPDMEGIQVAIVGVGEERNSSDN